MIKGKVDKRENLLVMGLFLMESLEQQDGRLKVDGEEIEMIDYSVVYGEDISILNIKTKIKKFVFKILRRDEKYINDFGNVLTFVDMEDKLTTLRV